jgi:hypothetical protein
MIIEPPVFTADKYLFQPSGYFVRGGAQPPYTVLREERLKEPAIPVLHNEGVGLQRRQGEQDGKNQEHHGESRRDEESAYDNPSWLRHRCKRTIAEWSRRRGAMPRGGNARMEAV